MDNQPNDTTVSICVPSDRTPEGTYGVKSVLVDALSAFIAAREDASAYVAERYAGNSDLDNQAKIAEVEGCVSLARRLLRGVHTEVSVREANRGDAAAKVVDVLAALPWGQEQPIAGTELVDLVGSLLRMHGLVRSKRTMFKEEPKRVKGESHRRWCEVTIELQDHTHGDETHTRLSISGSEGYILTPREARKEALDHWISYFDGEPEQIIEMNQRFDRHFSSARGAAKFVVETDGKYHGLNVHTDDGEHVYITDSCGQIRDAIARWFPEVMPYFKWHLNECEHQEDRGETYQRCE